MRSAPKSIKKRLWEKKYDYREERGVTMLKLYAWD